MRNNFFKRNIGLKFFSLALACLLELYFYSPENLITEEFTALVDVRNLPENLIIVDPVEVANSNFYAKFKVRGPAPLIKQIGTAEHRLIVKAPKNFEKKFKADLDLAQLGFPPAVQTFDLSPSALEFKTERIVEKRVPVLVQTAGEVANGYHLDSITVEPDMVLVKGPVSELKGLKGVRTDTFYLDAIDSDSVEALSLRPVGRISSTTVNTVTLKVRVSAIEATRNLEKVNVKVLAPKGVAATVSPSSVSAVITGQKSLLERVDESQLELKIEASKFNLGKTQVSLIGNLTDNIKIIETTPERVEVTLVKNK